jgi:glycosyltransferase involved in cell wall biosynthesis
MKLSIVVPSYNEETNLRNGVLHVMKEYLDKQSYAKEVIIVDDGSDDQSVELVKNFITEHHVPYFQLIQNPHSGKAGTVITGMLAGTGDIVMFTDMDQATPISEIEKLLPYFDSPTKADIVFGSRAGERKGAPIIRRIMARGFMLLRGLILGLNGIRDTQCGFKAFRREVAHDIFKRLKIHGEQKAVKGAMVAAGFDLEVLFLAKKLGYKLQEVPVVWHYVGTRRVNMLKDSYRGLRDMIVLRLNDIRNKYDA